MPRKKAKKKIKINPVFHIFCEGEKTEPYYIKGYIDHYHSDKRNILIIEKTEKNTPVQLVEEAIAHKNNAANKKDVYWVVFDREAVTKYSHDLHLKARRKAKKNGIEIAFSNICFEFWLLLHFTYSTASYACCDDLLKQSQLKTYLKKKGINNYDKGFLYLFDRLKSDIPTACNNAKKARKAILKTATYGQEAPCYLNPYTDIDELFIDMKNFIDNKPSVRDN